MPTGGGWALDLAHWRRRAQLWILPTGGGWALDFAWATVCPALDLVYGRLLNEGRRASGATTRRCDGEEDDATGEGDEVGLRDGEEGGATGGGEEVGAT